MKTVKILATFCLLMLLINCKKDAKVTDTKTVDSANADKKEMISPEIHKELYGIYSGNFIGKEMFKDEFDGSEFENSVEKRLSLKINRITKDSVYGQSIVNGNQRKFQGIFNESANSFVLDEPGTDKTDGRFEVKISGDSLTGKWSAFNKSAVKSPNKTLKLVRKDFVYNPNFMLDENSDLIDWANPKDFVEKYIDPDTKKTEKYNVEKNRMASDAVFKLNASKEKLTENQLKNLRKLDLQIIKNSVFARHGYSFKKETYRNFFEQTDWYIPVSSNVDADLTPMEKENVALLNRFIQYAEDRYDHFGR